MTVTAIEPQRKPKARVSVYLDGEFWTGMPAQLAGLLGLHVGQVLSKEQREHIEREVVKASAMTSATRLLSHRPRSEQELRKRLGEQEFNQAVIETTVEQLAEYGYVDDSDFAAQKIEALKFKGKARHAVQWELRKAGVDGDVVQAALDEHYPEEQEAEVAWEWARSRYRGDEKTLAKLQRQLAARGFSWPVIQDALARGAEQDE